MPPTEISNAERLLGSFRGHTALVLMLAAGALLSGCGSTSSHHTANGTGPAHTISFPIKQETHADIVAAVEACREGVDLGTWLPRGSKLDLYASCDKGLKRGLTEVRQYGEQVCSEVVFTMPSRTEAEKARVLDTCEAKTKKFAPTVH
jgi:uncharacterized protein YceK